MDVTELNIFNEEQLAYLSSVQFINRIDDNLKAVSSVLITDRSNETLQRIQLLLELYFYDQKVDTLSFDLHNYSYEDVVHILKNVRENEFLLQEIDNYLAGDIVE